MFGQQREEKKNMVLRAILWQRLIKSSLALFSSCYICSLSIPSTWSGKTDPESLTRAEVTLPFWGLTLKESLRCAPPTPFRPSAGKIKGGATAQKRQNPVRKGPRWFEWLEQSWFWDSLLSRPYKAGSHERQRLSLLQCRLPLRPWIKLWSQLLAVLKDWCFPSIPWVPGMVSSSEAFAGLYFRNKQLWHLAPVRRLLWHLHPTIVVPGLSISSFDLLSWGREPVI